MRVITLLLISALYVRAAVLEAEYTISYWFLSHIGTTTLRYEDDGARFRIEAKAQLHGFAALLAHHHTEQHTSTGHIGKDGLLIPEEYVVIRTYDDYRREQRYYFDRRHKRILLQQNETTTRNERRYDTKSMRYVNAKIPVNSSFFRLEHFYAENDLLTLYFNARSVLKSMRRAQEKKLPAVGSRDGIVTVEKEAEPFAFVFLLDQDIFRSKEGKLFVTMDNEYYVKNAVLKDVFLFGDLTVEREALKASPQGLGSKRD